MVAIMQRNVYSNDKAWKLTGAALLLAGVTLAGCGSSTSEGDAPASGGSSAVATEDDSSNVGVDDEALDELEEAQAELEELRESATFGSGSGTVTIEGVDYSFDAEVCYIEEDSFEASGPGQTADGQAFWVSLSRGFERRSVMENAGLPKESIDIMFGDKDELESFSLDLELGKADLFSSGEDDMAHFSLNLIDITEAEDLSLAIDGRTLSGSGSVYDENGVAIEFNVYTPVTFSATCDYSGEPA